MGRASGSGRFGCVGGGGTGAGKNQYVKVRLKDFVALSGPEGLWGAMRCASDGRVSQKLHAETKILDVDGSVERDRPL